MLKVAILAPVKIGLSLGAIKHLKHIAAELDSRDDTQFVLFTYQDALSELDFVKDFVRVKRSKLAFGFTDISAAVNAGGFDVALNIIARPVRGLKCPLVTIVQNVEPLQKVDYSIDLFWFLRLLYLRIEIYLSCLVSDRIIAVSKYTKKLLVDRGFKSGDAIDVVYHGVSTDGLSRKPKDLLIQGNKKIIFMAGSLVYYRGFEDVIRSIVSVDNFDYVVLVAGGAASVTNKYFKFLTDESDRLGVSDRFVWLGNVSSEEMRWCYENCHVFVQTSRAEACPNIVLESIYNSCFVISCDKEPMPEIYGDYAIYYRIGEVNSLAPLLNKYLREDSAREFFLNDKMGQTALRLSVFSWKNCAVKTVDVLLMQANANKIGVSNV
ncbi:MAG: glycosyltransferase [Dechloromonas sp.]|nr:glycosyltransferase [Dechloromonas sp.]